MNEEVLATILKDHLTWQQGKGGAWADLSGADLRGADLSGADLRGADLSWADLSGAKGIDDYIDAVTTIIPKGTLTVYKKCQDGVIVTLQIGKNVKRSCATGRKCRSESAKVIAVDGAEYGVSTWNDEFVYRVGETVKVDNFDNDRWNECSSGVHWFITRYEAENY